MLSYIPLELVLNPLYNKEMDLKSNTYVTGTWPGQVNLGNKIYTIKLWELNETSKAEYDVATKGYEETLVIPPEGPHLYFFCLFWSI